MLVATAIFAIAAAVAFILYTAAQKSYKSGENFSDQQQSTRVAFDRMISDLRLAGFNWNPDGDSTRIDEQVEGAWDTAVTIRGDFDFEDPAASATPEAALPGTAYNVVSTGNDEIVTYALAKDAGSIGGDTLTVFLDKTSPRDTTTEQIDVNNVALAAQSDPPYTLYRITLNSSGDAVKEPLADSIRSMSFTYYDANGSVLDPANMGGAETVAARGNRANIRRITVEIEGMTPNNDVRWTDPADTDADTQHRRKFNLISDVQARNLGMVGAPDVDNVPPSIPTGLSACSGHCGGLVLNWTPNASSEYVTQYNIKYGTSAGSLGSVTSSATPPAYVSGLSDASSYYFSIQAQDSAGNKSNWSSTLGPIALSSDTTPTQVQNLAASSGGTTINVTWDTVADNTSAGASAAVGGCDPSRPVRRDSGGYKVYRQRNPGGTFNAGDTGVELFTSAANSYNDTGAALCVPYGYRVSAVDSGCSAPLEGALSTMATGATSAAARPAKPVNGQAQIITGSHARLTWDPVTQDTASPTANTISIEGYNVYTADVLDGVDPTTVSYNLLTGGNLSCSAPTDCQHNGGGGGTAPGETRWYRVAAATDCLSPNDEGYLSDPFPLSCQFNGSISFVGLSDGDDVTAGTVPITIRVTGSGYTQASFTMTKVAGGETPTTLLDNTPDTSIPGEVRFTVSWDASGKSGAYRLDATVTQSDGCNDSVTPITIDLVTPISCCISVGSIDAITQGSAQKTLLMTFSTICGVDLTVTQVSVLNTYMVTANTKLKDMKFDSDSSFFTSGPGVDVAPTAYVHTLSTPKVLTPGNHTLRMEFSQDLTNCSTNHSKFRVTIYYKRPETGDLIWSCVVNTEDYIITCL
jgi:type II secretory pathway pseudopilin PulG